MFSLSKWYYPGSRNPSLAAPGSGRTDPPLQVPLGSARFVSALRSPLLLRSRRLAADSVAAAAAAAPAFHSGPPAQDFPQPLAKARRSLRASAWTARESARLARPGPGRAPLLRRARGRGGRGSGARHVSEPAAALLRPAAQGRARPAPPARPGPAQPVVPAGGRPPARVPPALGSGLSSLGGGEVVLPTR